MAVNFDSVINNARSVLRGEASGSLRFLAAGIAALAVWIGVFIVSDWTAQSSGTLTSQQGRFRTLLMLGNEYKAISPSARANAGNVDVATVFAQVSERMQLGSRVNRISPDGRNQAVEINRLYAEELAELQRQLASRGVRFIAVELRALPAGSERLFTVSAIIGPMS
ncbi:MAG: hypothetical protein IJS28_05705 [Synergistaceae bacterium]|nr:hypothetical protein [Synergistaceae bacterium]